MWPKPKSALTLGSACAQYLEDYEELRKKYVAHPAFSQYCPDFSISVNDDLKAQKEYDDVLNHLPSKRLKEAVLRKIEIGKVRSVGKLLEAIKDLGISHSADLASSWFTADGLAKTKTKAYGGLKNDIAAESDSDSADGGTTSSSGSSDGGDKKKKKKKKDKQKKK